MVILDDTTQLPANYRPRSIQVWFDDLEVFRVVDGETIPNPQYTKRDRQPSQLEMYWDDQLVYVCTDRGVTLNRLENVTSQAIQNYFDLDNF